MAAPPYGFRAHDRGSLPARQSREPAHGVRELRCVHVIGVAAKCRLRESDCGFRRPPRSGKCSQAMPSEPNTGASFSWSKCGYLREPGRARTSARLSIRCERNASMKHASVRVECPIVQAIIGHVRPSFLRNARRMPRRFRAYSFTGKMEQLPEAGGWHNRLYNKQEAALPRQGPR
jgi:hypothetical protein